MTFDVESDSGPFETLFRAFQGQNVKLNGEDCTIVSARGGSVEVRMWIEGVDDFEASGETRVISYLDAKSLTVY